MSQLVATGAAAGDEQSELDLVRGHSPSLITDDDVVEGATSGAPVLGLDLDRAFAAYSGIGIVTVCD
jgi:hypothetical protein